MRTQGRTPPDDRQLARLFAGWHGVLDRAQLIAAGLGRDAVKRRVRTGRLQVVHPGVYSLVHPSLLSLKGRWLAAVRACGEGALLGHTGALALRGLCEWRGGPIEVTVAFPRDPKPKGIRVHRSRTLAPEDRREWDRIPATSIERALIDYADHHDQRAVESAADQAEVKGLLNLTSLAAAVQRNPGRHGAAVLARLLEDYTFGANLTESELEDEFFRFCDRQRLRRPESQVEIGPYRVDFYWREQRLAVETDSWRWHGGRSAWEEDGKRNLWLKTQKIEVARLTWRRIRREAKGAVTDLIALGGEGLLVA